MAKQKSKEETEKRLLDQRAKFIEKTRSLLHFEPISEDKPRKSGGKVRCIIDWSGYEVDSYTSPRLFNAIFPGKFRRQTRTTGRITQCNSLIIPNLLYYS